MGPRAGRHGGRHQQDRAARLNIGGFFFSAAPPDFRDGSDWLCDSDVIVIHADPDHIGWYLAHDVRSETHLPVMFLGMLDRLNGSSAGSDRRRPGVSLRGCAMHSGSTDLVELTRSFAPRGPMEVRVPLTCHPPHSYCSRWSPDYPTVPE